MKDHIAKKEIFGAGDGVTKTFKLPVSQLTSSPMIWRTDWQGEQLMYDTPRANRLLWSDDLTKPNWLATRTAISIASTLAPDGASVAFHLANNASVGQKYLLQNTQVIIGEPYSQTVYAKAAEFRFAQIGESLGFGSAFQNIDLLTGQLGQGTLPDGSVIATLFPDGWVKITISRIATADSSLGRFLVSALADDGNLRLPSTPGDGVSGIYLWGFQLEISDISTSYIPTESTPVTITDYTVDDAGLITFAVPPLPGAVLTWTGRGSPQRTGWELDPGRELVTYVEIEQDFCALTYGTAPCLAILGETGQHKCYNTMRTCQSAEQYTPEPLTLRFCKPAQDIPAMLYVVPSVVSVSTAPTIINPGGGGRRSGPLGQRATLKVVFEDHPGTDNVVDPYLGERDFNPLDLGTWWGKWLARNPYYNNRIIRVREGYKGQALADMMTRTYLIDKIDGPANGRVTVTAKDILKLADNDKAQAPRPSKGELMVDYAEAAAITSLRVTGALAAEYPENGTVRINRELMTYTTVTVIDETEIQLHGIARATDGSEQKSHKAGDRAQICLRYVDVRVDELAYEWLTAYADVPTTYIPRADWDAEAALWLQQFELTGMVTEPTGVNDLLAEITEQCLFNIWWNERDQEIKLEATKPPMYEAVPRINDESHIVADSVTIKDVPADRVSQVWVFWGQIDPTERVGTEENYRRLRVSADLDAESEKQFGDQRIRKIYSRWLRTDGQVLNVTSRLLNRLRNTPKRMTLDVDAKDRGLWTGDIVDVKHHGIVSFTGHQQEHRYQILSAEEVEPGHKARYELEMYEYTIAARPMRWMAEDAPDYADATEEERETGGYWGDRTGRVDGDDGYTWV